MSDYKDHGYPSVHSNAIEQGIGDASLYALGAVLIAPVYLGFLLRRLFQPATTPSDIYVYFEMQQTGKSLETLRQEKEKARIAAWRTGLRDKVESLESERARLRDDLHNEQNMADGSFAMYRIDEYAGKIAEKDLDWWYGLSVEKQWAIVAKHMGLDSVKTAVAKVRTRMAENKTELAEARKAAAAEGMFSRNSKLSRKKLLKMLGDESV